MINRIKFWLKADRLGPDMPLTHILLHFPLLMRRLCQKKFKRFGAKAEFRPGAYAVTCSKISLGDRVIIRPGTMLFADPGPNGAGIEIEDNVMLGSGVHIYCANHRFDNVEMPLIDQGHYESQSVTLKNGCWVGANAIILPGVVVGRNSVVGAGSIVTKDIPSGVVAVGNPAKVIKRLGVKWQ